MTHVRCGCKWTPASLPIAPWRLAGDATPPPVDAKFMMDCGTKVVRRGLGTTVLILGWIATAFASTPEDATLRRRIHERFFYDARVQSYHFNIETNDGVVTLRGNPTSIGEAAHAALLAATTEGVREVRSTVRVNPPRRSDAALFREARARLRNLAGLQGSHPRVTVRNQVAILAGVFNTLADRDAAVNTLSDIIGIRAVRIQAQVQPARRVTDRYLTTAAARMLVSDGALDVTQIRVGARGGTLWLTGTVPDLGQKLRAETLVRGLTGVQRVASRLQVAPPPARVSQR